MATSKVAIYTRTSSKKSNPALTVSKARQVSCSYQALKQHIKVPLSKVCKISETLSGCLPLSQRPAFKSLVSGQRGVLKVFVESARAVARNAALLACYGANMHLRKLSCDTNLRCSVEPGPSATSLGHGGGADLAHFQRERRANHSR